MAGQSWRFLWLVLTAQYGMVHCYDTSVETELLSSLFNSSTYNRFVRPSSLVNVTVKFVAISLHELDIKTQTMSISGYLEVEWTDDRLTWSGAYSSVLASTVSEDTVWYPPLAIVNSVGDPEILYDGITPIRMFPSGKMEWLPLRKFEVHCDTNPSFYPFDTQTCGIAMAPWTYSSDLVELVAASGDVFSLDFYHTNGEWEYVDSFSATQTVQRAGSESITLMIGVKYRRRPQFHIVNTILPIMLLGFLNGFIFALQVDAGGKIGFVLTVLLAYAVYLTLVAGHIPTTSDHMSILSILLLMVLMLSVLSIIVSIYVLKICGHGDDVPIPCVTKRITQVLACLSCKKGCRRPNKKVDVEEEGANGKNKKDDKTSNGKNKKDDKSKQTWVQDISAEDTDEDALTWRDVAETIDRFCFVWYFIITGLMFGGCLFTMLYGYANYL